jgi:hypothetical protein
VVPCNKETEQISDSLLITSKKPEDKVGKCKNCNSRAGTLNKFEPNVTKTFTLTKDVIVSKYTYMNIKEQIEKNGGNF